MPRSVRARLWMGVVAATCAGCTQSLGEVRARAVDAAAVVPDAAAPGGDGGAIPGDMVVVPAGTFTRGCSPVDSDCGDDEKPAGLVELSAFWIDRAEVTIAEYRPCVAAGACPAPAVAFDGDPSLPARGVPFAGAEAFCARVGKRLPTEAEWEKAARGTDARIYPWGNEPPTCARANFAGGCSAGPQPVLSHVAGASPFGALDMAGNVGEWVRDWYGPYAAPEVRDPTGPAVGSARVFRGGSYDNVARNIRSSLRGRQSPTAPLPAVGFRCARRADAR